MSQLAIVTTVNGTLEEVSQRLSEAIKTAGFGILTRIDFAKTIQEKLGEFIQPCIILGACNPKLVFEAYKQSSDVALLIPCNIVLTEIAQNKIRVEVLRPTQMLKMVPSLTTSAHITEVEDLLSKVLLKFI